MKNNFLSPLLLCFFLFFVACSNQNVLWSKVSPERMAELEEESRDKTQLEIRQMQTREFDKVESKVAMKTLLNVLQDDGFIVKNAVLELGLLSATKEIDVQDAGDAFLATILFGVNARWARNSIIEATANVSEFGDKTRVRVNFKVKTLDNYGGIRNLKVIDDLKYYQEFFAKVDKGLFIQKEQI